MAQKRYPSKINSEIGQAYPKTSANDEKLTNQCLFMHELLSHRTAKLRELSDDDFCYIVSTKWLQEWKEYVNYNKVTGNQEDNPTAAEKTVKKYPGKINADIIAKREEQQLFYNIPKELKAYQYLNQLIEDNKKKEEDYIAVTKEIWSRFLSLYQGSQIMRPVRKYQNTMFYEGDSLKCDVVFVNLNVDKQQKISKSPKKPSTTSFNKNKMLLPSIWNLKELTQFLSKYCDLMFKKSEPLRVWLGYSYYSSDILIENLVESISKKKYQVHGRELTEQRYSDRHLSSYIKTTNTLIIELGNNLKSDETFQDVLIGLCQYCTQKRELIISCMCLEVVYCSRKCRIYDQPYHFNTCTEAFDSDSDKDTDKAQIRDVPKIGFKNLGNTCYMNSVTQVILSLNYFREFFSTNTYLNHMSEKQLQENNCILLRKLSKTIKSMSLEKGDAYVPWPLKGQVDYNISPFRGDKQQDANDFLVNFFNAINDYLKKQGDKAYHQIFEPFIGEFHSKVICPTCKIESENNQIFLQLSLPIKSKSKQAFYQYTVIESPNKHLKGKAQILTSWMCMKKKVNAYSSLVFILKQPEGLIQINQAQKNPTQATRVSKGELLYYKNLAHVEGEQIFIFNLVNINVVVKQIKRSPYGLPIPISVDYIQKNLGTFWLQIIKTFFSQNHGICAEADNMEKQYFTKIEDLFKQQLKQGQESNESKTIEERQQQENEKLTKLATVFHNKLRMFAQKIGIQVYVICTKKFRNLCKFCNAKCTGCHLPKSFDTSFEDFFNQKFKQVRFQVLLRDKLQIQVKQISTLPSGEPSIHDCLSLFSQPEQLDEQNAWYCDKCDLMCLALKQMHVKTFPSLLILHINRFKNLDGKKQKNNDPILYSQVQTFGNCNYRLIGVVIHEGTMDAGHYWSIALRGEKYYVFNDSKVSEVQNVFNKNAYILLYQRFDFVD